MKLSYILIIVGGLSSILSLILFNYFKIYLNIFGLFLSLTSLGIGFIWEYQNRKTSQLSLEENRAQHLQIIEKIEKHEGTIRKQNKKTSKLESINTKLKQLANKITIELQKEHLSKDNLLRRIDKPVYALLVHKTEEIDANNKKNKPLRDIILPSLGFKYVKGCRGLYVLTPSFLPSFKDRKELEKWINIKIINQIPKNLRYVTSFISLIDLRYTISIQKDRLTKKYDTTLIDSINAEELINFSEGLNYLQKKKTLSIKDIIEIPNLFFLLDNTMIKLEDKENLKQKNEEIIAKIEEQVEKEIYTKDFPDLDNEFLYSILKNYADVSLKDIETIKSNAKFWIDLFSNKQIVEN